MVRESNSGTGISHAGGKTAMTMDEGMLREREMYIEFQFSLLANIFLFKNLQIILIYTKMHDIYYTHITF